jgi:meiotic recombination protein SPO11
VLCRILSEIDSALKAEVTVTKRDIYYHDPELFRNQGNVDRYVDDIAHTCQVTRRDLNVVSGLVRQQQGTD